MNRSIGQPGLKAERLFWIFGSQFDKRTLNVQG